MERNPGTSRQLADELHATARLVEKLLADLQGYIIAQTALKTGLDDLKGVVQEITRMVRGDGDGTSGFIVRLDRIEQRLLTLTTTQQSAAERWWKLGFSLLEKAIIIAVTWLVATKKF